MECIHDKFEEKYYYCNEAGGSCRAMTDSRCDLGNMIIDYTGCVQGFTPSCVNKTFENNDFQVEEVHTGILVPGFGCFLQVDRTLNGTWG